MKTYTAFCQSADGIGTVWIESIQADDLHEAKDVAVLTCASAWNMPVETIRVLGIAAGDVTILFWEDIDG